MLNEGALAVAQLDVRENLLGQDGKAAIQEAVRSKEGFKLNL